MINDETDLTAIGELRAMARLYEQRGLLSKAEELLTLAQDMEDRVNRPLPIIESATKRSGTKNSRDEKKIGS